MDWNTLLLALINSWVIPTLAVMFSIFAITNATRRETFLKHEREIKQDLMDHERRRTDTSNNYQLAAQAARDLHNRTNLVHQHQHDQKMAQIKQQGQQLTADVKATIDKAIAEYKSGSDLHHYKDGGNSASANNSVGYQHGNI